MFSDEQMKYGLIFAGISAMILLVILQLGCMARKGMRNQSRDLNKDMSISMNWKEYSSSLHPSHHHGHLAQHLPQQHHHHNVGYTHDNFGDDPNDLMRNSPPPLRSNGMNGGHKKSKNNRSPNGYGDDRSMLPLPPPPMKSSSSHHHHSSHPDKSSHHHHNHHRSNNYSESRETRHPQSHTLHQLQPDFYFMPHQRRYSGEVVRVFVD